MVTTEIGVVVLGTTAKLVVTPVARIGEQKCKGIRKLTLKIAVFLGSKQKVEIEVG